MIRRGIEYLKKYGLRRTLARSFLEVSNFKGRDSRLSQTQRNNSVNILSLLHEEMKERKNARVLELGSRAVTKESLRDMLQIDVRCEYTGLDIHEGPNVDVVGDAHELGKLFQEGYFDCVISKAIFEHLAMPWKVVLEINKVLRKDGILFINTLHTYPLHDKPWDFWRFSEEAWKVLLNRHTGFEILHTNMEFPCKVIPDTEVYDWESDHEAYLLSNVLARKIDNYDSNLCKWDISVSDIIQSSYPVHE